MPETRPRSHAPRAPSLAAVVLSTLVSFSCSGAEPEAFLNLSARGPVDRGENVLIGGLVLDRTVNVLLRGAGPALADLGVTNPLPRPRLSLMDHAGAVQATNTAWRAAIPSWLDAAGQAQSYDPAAGPLATLERVTQAVGAFPFAGEHDAALYVELPRGVYTVHLASDSDTAGVGLVEVYLVTDDIDPFPPSWRVRQDPVAGYTPTREGFAPIAVMDERKGRTLRLDFDAAFQWHLPAGATPTSLSAPTLEWTWVSTGTPELRHGRPGAPDSRGWLTAPRYTKTGPNSAVAACLTTVDTAGTVIREEATLTFTGPAAGTFDYRWGTDDTGQDRIGIVHGQAQGTFRWTRTSTLVGSAPSTTGARFFRVWPRPSADGRPHALWAVALDDVGPVLRHGDGPDACDIDGVREAIVTDLGGGQYVMYYDGISPNGFRTCLATSTDLLHWQKQGPALQLGPPGSDDAGSAISPWMIEHGGVWHMFYLAAPHHGGAPGWLPIFPYLTRKAVASSPLGPWTKQPALVPFDPVPGTFYSLVAAPGHLMAHAGEFLQFFSSTTMAAGVPLAQRTLGLARTIDLDGPWTIDPEPLLPINEQIENSSLYFEPSVNLWFLFTNHIANDGVHGEYTDAVWMYWSEDPTRWDSARKAIVVDATSSSWAKAAIGMPTVVRVGDRLAVFHDGGATPDFGHLDRDIGLAMLDLPLRPPTIP